MKIPFYAKAKELGEVPEGTWYFQAVKAFIMQNGRFVIRWKAVTGPGKGNVVLGGYNESVEGSGWLIRDLKTMGVTIDPDGGFSPEDLIGKYAEGTIKKNGDFVNIQKLKRAPAGWAPPAEESDAADGTAGPVTGGAAIPDDDEEIPFGG